MKSTNRVAIVWMLSVSSFSSFASSDKVNMAMEAAQALCTTPQQFGNGTSLKISASAKANVGKIIRNLVSAESQVDAEYTEEDWLGVRQEELAEAMKNSNSCKSQVFTLVMQDFGGEGWQKNTKEQQKKQPYLSNPDGGTTAITKTSDVFDYKDACYAESGSKVKLLSEEQTPFTSMIKVRILNGTCIGRIGWTSKNNYKI
ncbi:hypothetical protein [Aliivibrio fischeri]|uniref:hypothetical protein n=1 Tax=Aliivibrio fischeri TaxID=668 RepID=UPI0006D06298|nr:hypothetical protein [Aliivibrio fischeri]USR97094.1 hypothetical protein AVFI_18080 [Aliivibrio fischeri ATCC 7744 = JCM 18803 = DSM 507]GGK50033.1 hypothetical protein GCM10007987_36380 [Aliivibrio fischeri]